jgi:hypothetical protein
MQDSLFFSEPIMFRVSFKFVCLLFGLVLIQGIIFPQSNSGSWNPGSFTFDSGILSNRFDRADREITPQKWIEEARRGIESARILWEEMIPELYRDKELIETLSAEFNEWSERELENRFTQWLLNRFFGVGSEILIIEAIKERENADKLYLYKTDEEGNILFDENTGDPLLIRPTDDSYNFERDLILWRKQIEDFSQKEIQKYELYLTEFFPELLIYVDESRRGDFGKKLTEVTKTAVQSLQHELANLISREQRLFTARRLGDVYSLRKKSEDGSASSIGYNLIEETLRITNEGIAVLEAKIESAEAGNGDLALAGTEWLAQYREQFERGLRAWEEAEERFFIRRLEWEQDAIFHYNEAEKAWNEAFIQFAEARREWEYKTKNLFEAGELLFKDASALLEKTILEAKAEFAKDSRVRTESAVDKARAWADMYITASSVVAEAQNNLEFWQDRLSKEPNRNTENAKIILQEIGNWTFLYNSYYGKALEAKSFLENEFSIIIGGGLLFDVLAQGSSSEDFFLDEYQTELLRSQAVAGYWNKRVKIAQAVLNYAEDLTAGRITESEGIVAWEKAKADYDEALSSYQNSMEALKILGANSLQIQEKLREAFIKIQIAEAALEDLNRKYTSLIAAFEIHKENYYLEEIAIRYIELTEITNILDDTGPDSIMMMYLEKAYESGLIQEARFKFSLLKELVAGGMYFEKSLTELSVIVKNIKIFGMNDILPSIIEEYGIPKDDILYYILEELIDEKEYLISITDREDEKSIINKKYDTLIRALCLSAKNSAIRQEQNRILSLELLISPNIEINNESKLYAEWENASRNFLRAQVELELQAMRFYIYGELTGEDAMLLSGFCLFNEDNAIHAEKALETILSILEQNRTTSAINSALNKAALENEFIEYFLSLGSFFVSSNYYSFTDLFLDSYIAEIEIIEGMLIAYKFAELINPTITESIKNEKIQKLYSNYAEFGVEHTGMLPDDINFFIDALIKNSSDPTLGAAYFLSLFDEVIGCLPEWIGLEAMSWKEFFIEIFSYRTSKDYSYINEAELLNRLMEIEYEYSYLIYHNGLIDNTRLLLLERELYLLNYQFLIINKINNSTLNPENIQMILNSFARKTQLINSAYKTSSNTDTLFTNHFYNAVNSFVINPYLEWNENLMINELFMYPKELEFLANEWNSLMYWENIIFNEIKELKRDLDLLNNNDGSLELEIKRISNEISSQKRNTENLMDEYFIIAENFSEIALYYDVQYAESKKAYSLIEESRFNYETQDAIKRWASTAYLNIQDTLVDLHESQEKLRHAEAVLEFLIELYPANSSKRPYENEEYGYFYNKYLESYSDLHISVKATELLNKALYEETQNNKFLHERYQKQIMIFGGALTFDFFNQDNHLVQTLVNYIRINGNRLGFLRDSDYNLSAQTKEEKESLSNYFSSSSFSEFEKMTVSEFEHALLNLNQRLKSYNFTFEKYIIWSSARNYLLFQLSKNFNENTKQLFGIDNQSINFEYSRFCWNMLTETERADLEFLTILNLAKSDDDFFKRVSEYKSIEQAYTKAYDEYKRLHEIVAIPIIGLFYYDAYQKASYEFRQLRDPYYYLSDCITDSFGAFISNIGLLESKYNDYIKSSKKLSLLYGNNDETQGLLWIDIKNALTNLGMNDSEMQKIESFWLEASISNDLSGLNIPQVLDFILGMRKIDVNEKKQEFENIWSKLNEESLIAGKEYHQQYEFYLSGEISIDTLKLSALRAFGNQNIFTKDHLSNMGQLIQINMELFSGNEAGFRMVQNELLIDYVQLINLATASRYDAELQYREAEWEIQRNDLEEKYHSWLDASIQILERGIEDWKDNSVKLVDAYSLWARTFETEYYRTNDAWTAAYLEGLNDKEAWVERATLAAQEASSNAMLILIGSDGEAMARAMDTRAPVFILDYSGALEAKKTLDSLLFAVGIHRLDDIFGSMNSIVGTVNTTIRSGLGMGNMGNYGIIQSEASRLARTAKEDVYAREAVRIAVNLRDMADQAIKALEEKVESANADMRKQMDDIFIVQGSWRRFGLDYHKDVLVHSTFIDPIITDSAFIQGYINFVFNPVHINTDLSEDRIKYLNSIAVQVLVESLMLEVSEIANRIFGSGVSETNSSSIGEFYIHIGNSPDPKAVPNIDNGKSGMFNHYGDGELGRLLTEFHYWYFLEQRGQETLKIPFWNRTFWDSRGSFFQAPSLKTTVSIAIQIIATVASQGAAAPIAPLIAGISSDLTFNVADAVVGHKSWAEAGIEFGKSTLINLISYKAGTVVNGLTSSLANAAASGAMTQVSASLGSVIITGVKDITVGTINSAISAVSYSDLNGWGWSSESFSAGVTSSLKGSLVSATGSVTSSVLNIGQNGFTGELYSDGNTLHNLLGGLAAQGVNYALGGDFTLNLFNLSIFNTSKTNYNMGLLELHIGRNGVSMELGTGGADASVLTLASAIKGLETWKVNMELILSDTAASRLYRSQLRTLYSGNKTLRNEYKDILAGKTIYEERRDVEHTKSVYDEITGVKTVYLGSDALDDGSRFGLNVVFAHEAYRNGIIESDELQSIKTSNAVYGHSQTALDIVNTYGIESLSFTKGFEAIAYMDYLITGNNGLMETIVQAFDSSDEYWKLMRNSNNILGWVYDNSSDFDINYLLLASNSQGNSSVKEELNKLSEISMLEDGKEAGIISAERMTPYVAWLLGNAIISRPIQDGVFEYKDIDAQSVGARNFLIKDTMNKMAINAKNMTGVYNAINPWILGKGSGENDYDYLVPYVSGILGSAIYIQMSREVFLNYYDALLVTAGMRYNGGNYVWGGKDIERDGGLDCSGYVRWAQMQVYGQNITIRNAHDQRINPNLTLPGNGGPGSLNYYTDDNGVKYHHVTINLGNGMELNPNGGPKNERDNPAKIEIMNLPILKSHQRVDNRRTNWHYLFFIDKGQIINHF